MKKSYTHPVLRVIELPEDDLIATSSEEPTFDGKSMMMRRYSLWDEDDVW